jgi:iron complex outermembrane recepter protein
VFCSLIQDYITYAALSTSQKVNLPGGTNALAVQFANTDLASLAGFELYTEFDYTDYLTPFMTMSYVEGRDHARAGRGRVVSENLQVLPGVGFLGAGIPPLETRMGLRFHEARRDPRWGLELAGRFVASQDRVASSLREQRSSGFAVYDVRSFWKARQGLLLTAGIENVFDRFYREHLDLLTGRGVFQPGLNGYFGVEMQY